MIIQSSFKLLYIEIDVKVPCMLNCCLCMVYLHVHHMCLRKSPKSFDSIECNQENCNVLRHFSQHLNQTCFFVIIWQINGLLVVKKKVRICGLYLLAVACKFLSWHDRMFSLSLSLSHSIQIFNFWFKKIWLTLCFVFRDLKNISQVWSIMQPLAWIWFKLTYNA